MKWTPYTPNDNAVISAAFRKVVGYDPCPHAVFTGASLIPLAPRSMGDPDADLSFYRNSRSRRIHGGGERLLCRGRGPRPRAAE